MATRTVPKTKCAMTTSETHVAAKPDHRHRWLLRSCRERPRRGAAEQRDKIATAAHSITSSALASNIAGTLRPNNLAVCRLMISSNLLDCTWGI